MTVSGLNLNAQPVFFIYSKNGNYLLQTVAGEWVGLW